jgi:hypothetical protein
MKAKFFFCWVFLFLTSAQAVVWNGSRDWTQEDEIRYSIWVENELDVNIFTSAASKYYGLETDCADFVYTARAIYAFENQLVFAVNDPTNSANTINNKKTNWDHDSSEIGRFFSFARYFHQMISTSTLHKDTYPVALTRDYVQPGSLFLFYKYHSMLVKSVSSNGIPTLYESTVPYKVRSLYARTGIPAVFFDKMANPGGLRKFKPAQFVKKSEWEFQGYSTEQYDLRSVKTKAADWTREVHRRLSIGNQVETSKSEMIRHFSTVCTLTKERINIVKEAVRYRQKVGRVLNAVEYENYSTPSRDQKLKEHFLNFIEANTRARATDYTVDTAANLLDNKNSCSAVYDGVNSMSLWQFYLNMMNGKVSSDPNDSLRARWGF